MSYSEQNESPNTRWWESYLVRYFLGFIVGTFCIIALIGSNFPKHAPVLIGEVSILFHEGNSISPTNNGNPLPKTDSTNSTLKASNSDDTSFGSVSAIGLALLGLAYCYIASTPITVIHAARMYRTWFERQTRTFWFGWTSTLGLTSIGLGQHINQPMVVFFYTTGIAIILLVDPFYFNRKKFKNPNNATTNCLTPKLWVTLFSKTLEEQCLTEKKVGRTTLGFLVNSIGWILLLWGIVASISLTSNNHVHPTLVAFSLPAIWVCLVQYTLLINILTKPQEFSQWYQKISIARRNNGARDIRETYTHLREHANSVFIFVIELSILALILTILEWPSKSLLQPEQLTPYSIDPKYLIVAFFGIWLTPTIFMWSRANWLEQEFADNPTLFNLADSKLNATPANPVRSTDAKHSVGNPPGMPRD